MEYVKQALNLMGCSRKITDQFYVDDDYNVPDIKSDVRRVVISDADTSVEEIRHVEKYLRVSGNLHFRILYVTDEGESHLAALEGKIPFEEMVYVEEQEEGPYQVIHTRADLTTTVVHSRKFALKALVELEISSEGVCQREIVCDVESDAIQKRIEQMNCLTVHTCKRDNYRIKEELELPGTKETIGAILWSDVSRRKLEIRLQADRLEIQGELLVFCLYESLDEKQDYVLQTVPFEGTIPCNGVEPSMYDHLVTKLRDVNLESHMDEDGEMRIIGVEATLEADICIYEEKEIQVLQDAYALGKDCELTMTEETFERLLIKNQSRCKIKEKLSLPEIKNDMLQICHSSGKIQIESMEMGTDGLSIDGILHICFLYIKADDMVPYSTWQGMVPFNFFMECKGMNAQVEYELEKTLEQLSVGLLGDGKIEVKAVLAFDGFFKQSRTITMVENLELKAPEKKNRKMEPGIIGYIVKEGDELWDLAKRYHTTVEGICEVNELSQKKVNAGDKILLFKENMGIL